MAVVLTTSMWRPTQDSLELLITDLFLEDVQRTQVGLEIKCSLSNVFKCLCPLSSL